MSSLASGADVAARFRQSAHASDCSTYLELQELADRFFITRNTFKSHARRTYAKIGVSTRADAAAYAREQGLAS